MVYDNKEMAAFNLAMPYLTRINSILNSNYLAIKNGDTRLFAINLKQLYRELVPWLVVKVDDNPDKCIDEKTPLQDAFEALSKLDKKNKDDIWEKMEDIEMMMRMHFKQLGMLMPKVSDPRFLFGNRQR